jgi:hypothetical protein
VKDLSLDNFIWNVNSVIAMYSNRQYNYIIFSIYILFTYIVYNISKSNNNTVTTNNINTNININHKNYTIRSNWNIEIEKCMKQSISKYDLTTSKKQTNIHYQYVLSKTSRWRQCNHTYVIRELMDENFYETN